MTMLKNQSDVSAVTPMPVDRTDEAAVATAVAGETITFFFVDSGAYASATTEAAGTLITAKLGFTGVLNQMNSAIGTANDTSFAFVTGTVLTTQVGTVTDETCSRIALMTPTQQVAEVAKLLSSGEYFIDHRRGQIWGIAAAQVANDTANYDYGTPAAGGAATNVNINQIGGAAVPTLGTTTYTEGTTKGQFFGAVRNDVLAALADTDNEMAPLQVNAEGALYTADVSGSFTDDSAFTPGTTSVSPIAGFFDDVAPDSVDEGDGGAVRMSANRNLYTQLRDAAGNERGANVDASNQLLVVEASGTTIAGDTTSIDGKITACNTGAVTVSAALPVGANTIGSVGVVNGAINGPAEPTIDSYTSAAIDEVTGADQVLIAAPGANKQLWIYGYSFICDTAATTVELQDEDDTVIVSYAGGFAQYGGVARNPSGNFAMPLFKVATNKALETDVVTGSISGEMQYAIVSV